MMASDSMQGNTISAPFLPEAAEWLSEIALPSDLAVAWSGGGDSTALMLALISQGYRVLAWHIDHGWREESASEAEMLRERAAHWGIPFLCARDPEAAIGNREAAARVFRYRQFAIWSRQQSMPVVCLAHHRQDQAETICLRMLQGSGIHGIRGMSETRRSDGLQIVRPLLHVSRDALRQALRLAEVPWVEDASNRDFSLWRNRIRHRLFPTMIKTGVDPWQLFLRWSEQARRLATIIDAEVATVPLMRVESGVSILWRDWAKLSPSVRARLLQKMTQMLFGKGTVPGRRHIRMVEEWTIREGSGGLDLSRSRLCRHQGRLHLVPASVNHAMDSRHD